MKKSLMFIFIGLITLSITMAQAEFYKPDISVPDNKNEMIEKVEAFVNAGFKGDTESMKATHARKLLSISSRHRGRLPEHRGISQRLERT